MHSASDGTSKYTQVACGVCVCGGAWQHTPRRAVWCACTTKRSHPWPRAHTTRRLRRPARRAPPPLRCTGRPCTSPAEASRACRHAPPPAVPERGPNGASPAGLLLCLLLAAGPPARPMMMLRGASIPPAPMTRVTVMAMAAAMMTMGLERGVLQRWLCSARACCCGGARTGCAAPYYCTG